MIDLVIDSEQERLERIAGEYREKGYDVLLHPHGEDLPGFLQGYQPDLVARKGDQAYVVEVKTRQALAQDSQIRELARILGNVEGWQFDLVVIGDDENRFPPENSLSEEEVEQGLDEAFALLKNGSPNAAMLLAWSSTEAYLRLLAQQEQPPINQRDPRRLIGALAMDGVIPRNVYELLRTVLHERNAIAHGYRASSNQEEIVALLIDTTKHLITSSRNDGPY